MISTKSPRRKAVSNCDAVAVEVAVAVAIAVGGDVDVGARVPAVFGSRCVIVLSADSVATELEEDDAVLSAVVKEYAEVAVVLITKPVPLVAIVATGVAAVVLVAFVVVCVVLVVVCVIFVEGGCAVFAADSGVVVGKVKVAGGGGTAVDELVLLRVGAKGVS